MELDSSGSGRFEQECECWEAWETPSADGGQGAISDGERGNNNKTTTANGIPTHVQIVSNPYHNYAVRYHPLILYFILQMR